jgi:hypothetical protein
MLILTSTVGGVTTKLTPWVDWTSVKVTDQLNVPTTLTFNLTNIGGDFPKLIPHAYVTLYSTRWKRSLFTGFINSAPTLVPLGLSPAASNRRKVLFTYQVSCTSDEFLLNMKSVQFIPMFINQTHGAILTAIADTLCPGIFNTDFVGSGDIVPSYAYDPSQSWSEIAKTFADSIRYRYKVRDKLIYFQPYGDGALGIQYDEDGPEGTYDPFGLHTTVFQVPLVNDITMIGAVEAGRNREDYFIGDGFTGNFPLRHKVFNGASTLLLNDDWTETSFDTQQWYVADPAGQFNLGNGALNLVSSFGFPLGFSYLQLNNGLELAGGLDVEHGEFGWNDASHGIVGGVYTDDSMTASAAIASFYISSPSGVTLTASGAVGVVMQAMYGETPVGVPIVSQANHTYVLQTLFNAPSYVRYLTQYRTLAGGSFGGTELDLPGSITFIVQDTDIAAATGFYYVPPVTKYVVNNATLPAFAVYGLINNVKLNFTLNYTLIAKMPLGTLQAMEGPEGLMFPSGVVLPMLPPGSGGYIGPVLPWPGDGSGAIYPPPLQRGVHIINEVLGIGFEQESAQITAGNSADTLAFYAQTLPTAGTPIRFQSWESQAAISRLQATGSIAEEMIIVEDDGIRAATVSNLVPLPRTSEDCDNAALAYLEDRTETWYNGTYSCTSYFLNQYTSDPVFWPVPGRFIFVNSPLRAINRQAMLVTQLTMGVLDAVGNAQNTLTQQPGQVGEVLSFQLTFGPDLHLEKVLANFNDSNPPNILTPQDTANPPDPRATTEVDNTYLPDVQAIYAYPIKDGEVGISLLDNNTFPVEIRLSDASWGQGVTPNYVGTFVAGQTFDIVGAKLLEGDRKGLPPIHRINPVGPINNPLPPILSPPHTSPIAITATPVNFILVRQQYDQTWYMRYVSGATTSRRTKVLRVVYPQKPAAPTIDYGDSHYVQFDFAGDIRSIFGFEMRALDNTTIIVQKPVNSNGDLLIDLTRTKATNPFTPIIDQGVYLNASGQMNMFGSGPLSNSNGSILWTDFVLTTPDLPTDAVIQGIYPVVTVTKFVYAGATIHYLSYDIAGSIYGDIIPSPASHWYSGGETPFFGVTGPTAGGSPAGFDTPETFFPVDTFNRPISIGNTTSAILGRTIASLYEASLSQSGLDDEMDISAVGFAIYYTSETFSSIDPQMTQPFPTTLPNQGIAWALPLSILLQSGNGVPVEGSPAVFQDTTVLDREFFAYFFNHQWSYSNPTIYNVPVPAPPILADPGTRTGLSVNVISDVLTRADIIYQRWQADAIGDFANPFLDITNNYQEGLFAFNAVATGAGGSTGSVGDVYVRSVRSDFFSSGNWSDVLYIPANPVGQVGVRAPHPTIVGNAGAIIVYEATAGWLTVDVSAFEMTYPDGSMYGIPSGSLASSATVDTHVPLTAGMGYLYYFSVANPTLTPDPTVDIDGPYADASTAALGFSTSEGRSALTQGPLTFYTANSLTGSVGGAGGGTFGA